MRMAIGGRGKLNHITGNPAAALTDDPTYVMWEQSDLMVCSWMLDNMESDLVHNYAEYPTARDLWEGLSATYCQGSDGVQVFDLNVKANSIKQGSDSIETLYSTIQKLWREIELRQPNPMVCPIDIATFNRLRAETKLHQFLAAVSDVYDTEKRDLLKTNPLPSVETTYATIRKEAARRTIMGQEKKDDSSSVVGTTSGIGGGFVVKPKIEESSSTIAQSFATKPRSEHWKFKSSSRSGGIDRSKIKCGHCGKMRHSKEECFQLIGFPEGWKSQRKDGTTSGTVATAIAGSEDDGNGDVNLGFVAQAAAHGKENVEQTLGYSVGKSDWAWH